jgi:uncharacterized protein with HEPN domain
MSKRDVRLLLYDILECIEKIEKYTKDMNFEDFVKNDLVADAVIRNLEIIGEAVKNIPEDIRSKYPDIPWKKIVGFRNIVIHGYFGVDLNIVWTVVRKHLKELKPKIESILKEIEYQN